MRKREEPMEVQNSVNEESDSNTQRQETEGVARREKVGEGAIRKMGKQREIVTKSKPAEVRDTQKREAQRRMTTLTKGLKMRILYRKDTKAQNAIVRL